MLPRGSYQNVSRKHFGTIWAKNLTRPKTAAPPRPCKIDDLLVQFQEGGGVGSGALPLSFSMDFFYVYFLVSERLRMFLSNDEPVDRLGYLT
jgi:hypothetical protein